MKKRVKSILPALGLITGTAIGAGFLGIPSVISKSGFLIGFIELIILALFVLFLKLCLGEVILRTRGNHQLTGYAEKYLGKTGKAIMFFALIFGILSAMVAYLIAEGETLSYLIIGNTSYALYFSLGFWLLIACLSYIGLKALKKYDKIGLFIVLFLVLIIFIIFFKTIKIENLTYLNNSNIFLPIGVILFSFLAFSAVPEAFRTLKGNERALKKTITLGIFIPFIVYVLFSLIVVGNFGLNIPEISVLVLGRFSSLLAVITLFTAFFTSAIVISVMFRFDFKTGRFYGWILACFVPLILFLVIYFFKLVSFVQLLSIAGIVSGGLTGICILFMNVRAKKLGKRKPEYTIKLTMKKAIIISALFLAAVACALIF